MCMEHGKKVNTLTQIKHINWLESHLNAYIEQHHAHNKCEVLKKIRKCDA